MRFWLNTFCLWIFKLSYYSRRIETKQKISRFIWRSIVWLIVLQRENCTCFNDANKCRQNELLFGSHTIQIADLHRIKRALIMCVCVYWERAREMFFAKKKQTQNETKADCLFEVCENLLTLRMQMTCVNFSSLFSWTARFQRFNDVRFFAISLWILMAWNGKMTKTEKQNKKKEKVE